MAKNLSNSLVRIVGADSEAADMATRAGLIYVGPHGRLSPGALGQQLSLPSTR